MTQFEYLASLISIVIAFGISQVLRSWGSLLNNRRRVSTYWVYSAWSVMIVMFMILFWWELWQYRTLEQWSFVALVWTIINAMFIVLAAHILLPSTAEQREIDLESFYYQSAPLFFGLTIAGMISIAVSDILIDPGQVHWGETTSRLAWLPFGMWVMVSQNRRVHSSVTIVALVLYAAFFVAISLK